MGLLALACYGLAFSRNVGFNFSLSLVFSSSFGWTTVLIPLILGSTFVQCVWQRYLGSVDSWVM